MWVLGWYVSIWVVVSILDSSQVRHEQSQEQKTHFWLVLALQQVHSTTDCNDVLALQVVGNKVARK